MKKIIFAILLICSQISIAQVNDTGDKVGIGNTSPSEKLDVNGNIKTNGNLIVSGDILTGGSPTTNGSVWTDYQMVTIPGGTLENWYKILVPGGALNRYKLRIKITGDNSANVDEFEIATAGYSFVHHITSISNSRYNQPKLIEIKTNKFTNSTVEVWVKLGATTLDNTMEVWTTHGNLVSPIVYGTPVFSGNGLASLTFDATIRNENSIITTGSIYSNKNIVAGANLEAVDINATGNLTLGADNIDADRWVNLINAGASKYAGIRFGSSADPDVKARIYTHTVTGSQLRFDTNGSEAMRINSSGFVGIGTYTPSAKFQVNLDTNEYVRIDAANGVIPRLYLRSNDNQSHAKIQYSNKGLNFHNASDALQMTIDGNSGNVGIGTSNPLEKLQIGNAFAFHDGGHKVLKFNVDSDNQAALRYDVPNKRLSIESNIDGVNKTHLLINSDSEINMYGDASISGNVGVGTTSPLEKLDVRGQSIICSNINVTPTRNSSVMQLIGSTNAYLSIAPTSSTHLVKYDYELKLKSVFAKESFALEIGDYKIMTASGYNTPEITSLYSANIETMTLNSGNVGIGTTTPDSKLTVDGKIHAEEVKVSDVVGADFVFEESYPLLPLAEVETFIKKNKHLPEIASAAEMQTNGLELGEMSIQLLQKIEELTLYTIAQQKLIEAQMLEMKKQATAIQDLQEKIK